MGLLSMAAFLYLIDYASKLLRPVSIAGRLGETGLRVIDFVYPRPTKGKLIPDATRKMGPPDRTVHHEKTGRIVLALNVQALLAEAESAGGVIEFVPRIGEFLGIGEPLFYLYGSAAAIEDRRIRSAVAFGPEHAMEQDATFAFRILVDIANKALSPAINDPTTAVLVMDQLQALLRRVGQRRLSEDEVLDKAGRLRLIFRTPNWEDFVNLTFTEIRHYGAGNVQIVRRLRAMIKNLIATLPEHRHPALRIQLDILDRTAAQLFTFPEDLALAQVSDTQGL
jgi:uncharacterized membrane protein